MPKKSSGKNKNQPKEGDQNGSSSGTVVPDEGALVENFPPASAGGENSSQVAPVVQVDAQPAQAAQVVQVAKPTEPNFKGGDAKPPPEESVNPDHLAVVRILASMISLKPFFSEHKDVNERKSFKGTPATKNRLDTRFCVESSSDAIVQIFLNRLGMEAPKKSKKSAFASSGRGSAAFVKTTPELDPKKGEKKSSSAKLQGDSSSAPVVPVKSYEDNIFAIFGNDPIPVSLFFSTQVDKKQDSPKTSSFLNNPTWESFIALFAQSGGKASDRYENNLTVFKCLLSQYFSSIEREDARFLAKMRLFLDIMSAKNQTCLFESSRSHLFLYELAIELLRKLGRNTKRISFEEVSSSHAAIVVLIFKYLYQKFDDLKEEDAKFQQMLVQLFRTITECFLENNSFLIEAICFHEKVTLAKFRLLLAAQSTGLAHNSLLDCDLSGFMLDPLKVWESIVGKKGVFAWIAQTGSGKSTLLLLLAILEAIQSQANVFYIGPETSTMNPEYVKTILEVVCQFLESCGRERPVIRLNQSGVAKCEAGVVNVFMTHDVHKCFPLLSSVFEGTPSIVAVDDNTQQTPKQLIDLFSKFNVSQLHICGSTIDLTACGDVVRIGADVASSVSFCAPTFMDQSGILPMSPDAYRVFLLATRTLRVSWQKFFKKCGNVSMQFITFLQSNNAHLQEFCDIISSFTGGVEQIKCKEHLKLARLLHKGFPDFQVGTVYSVKELNEITVRVRNFIAILGRIGFVFEDDERLQFPKDLSEAQREDECGEVIASIRKSESAPIILTSVSSAYDLERVFVSLSENANKPVMGSAKGLSTNPSDDDEGSDSGTKFDASKKNAMLKKSSIQDSAADHAASAASATATTTDDSHLTLDQILKRIFESTKSVGHRSLPTRKHVIEALLILCKCRHPDSARWLKSFIYGVVLLDSIMPPQFIQLCLGMFDAGRMIIVLAYELFHLQSWNSKCCLRMKIIVANSVPLWHLRQTMARAGRFGTEHSGEISSWVSCLVLPSSDVSACENVLDERRMPLMIENCDDVCPIEKAMVAMLCRGNFSRKHHAFIVEFLRLFSFVYRDQVCVHAFKGGHDYFKDFMGRFISGVLVSKFVSPFECVLHNLEDPMRSLAFTKFRHGYVNDVEKTKAAFSNEMLGLVGSDSASMSLCLARAVGAARKFVGISHFDLPLLFKELYEEYPDSLTSFLKLIRNLLMNLQTMPVCKCDRTVDATVSAMLLVVTKTQEFVGDILSLLADTLRERDMECFRVGFVPEVSPIEQLRELLNSKAGPPTLQDFSAFLRAHSDLKELDNSFTDVCNFLNSIPSGPFYDMQQKAFSLKKSIEEKKDEKKKVELSKAMPIGMKPMEWVKHQKSDKFKALREEVDEVQLPQLNSEILKLTDELASVEKVLGNLPTDLSQVVAYFKKLI